MIAGYLLIWSGVISLIGFAGWKQISDRYPAEHWPDEEGVALSWQSGSIGASRYNNVLKAVVAVDGLFLRPVRMFAFNHPPVFIPWEAIEHTSSGIFGSLKLHLEGGKALSIRGKMAKYVQEAMDAYDLGSNVSEDVLPNEVWDDAGPKERTLSHRQRTRA